MAMAASTAHESIAPAPQLSSRRAERSHRALALRRYGLGAMAMAGGMSVGANVFHASWPSAEAGPMGLEGAVELGFAKELAMAAKVISHTICRDLARPRTTSHDLPYLPAKSSRWPPSSRAEAPYTPHSYSHSDPIPYPSFIPPTQIPFPTPHSYSHSDPIPYPSFILPLRAEWRASRSHRSQVPFVGEASRRALHEKLVAKGLERAEALSVARTLETDDVIDPAESRGWIVQGLDAAGVDGAPTWRRREASKRRPCISTW